MAELGIGNREKLENFRNLTFKERYLLDFKVRVLEVDEKLKRIKLSMKGNSGEKKPISIHKPNASSIDDLRDKFGK